MTLMSWARALIEPRDERVLATVLFTEIAGSTEQAVRMGDRRRIDALNGHDQLVRDHVAEFVEVLVKTTGDGMLATFDRPTRAIRCARAVREAAVHLGMCIRAGIHTGELELRRREVSGIAVHIGARVSALAKPGEVLVSRTIRDLVVGSDLSFADRGSHGLRGLPDEWQLYSLA